MTPYMGNYLKISMKYNQMFTFEMRLYAKLHDNFKKNKVLHT